MTMPIMSLNVLSSEGSDLKILIPSLLLILLSALCAGAVKWRDRVRLSDTSLCGKGLYQGRNDPFTL